MGGYLRVFFQFAGLKVWYLMGLMVILGMTQGIGLAMILPFLHVIGIDVSGGANSYISFFVKLNAFLGVTPGLWSVISVYILIISIHSIAEKFKEILSSRLVSEFTHYLRIRLYAKFSHTSWMQFIKTPDADIIHVLTTDIQRVSMATQDLFRLLVSGLMVAIYILFSLTISAPMTCAALGCGVLFLVALHPFNRKAARFGSTLRNHSNGMYSIINNHIGGMKVAKSLNLESYYKNEFTITTAAISEQVVRFSVINANTRMCYKIGAAAVIAVFIVIGVQYFELSEVRLMVIVFLFSRILPGFSGLQQTFQRITNNMASFQAVQKMEQQFEADREQLSFPGAPNSPLFTLTDALDINGIGFRYDSSAGPWILEDITMKIPARRITAIAGHSGAGKTTLADILLGLLQPERGRVLIDGVPLDPSNMQIWRRCVGYVPQDIYLFHESIRDNLLKADPDATDEQLWNALERSSAKAFILALPSGLDTVVGDRGIKLSGGERQRISLARALLRKPLLLVLDEATSALDRDNELCIQSALDALKSELTIVVIAHRPSSLQNADQVITLDHGRVVSLG